MIRAPICTVVGHVDHGKTTLLDTIRGTAVAAGEAGAITQAIGASIIPIEHIQKRAAHMLGSRQLNIPGLLFIDTPGHAAFTGMRKRGGSLADIAILLVDLNEGFKPQTREALEILRSYKTPFIVAANKVDLSPGYVHKHEQIIQDIEAQGPKTLEYIETKLYELVGTLAEFGLPSERFDRLESFEKQIAIVPISAFHKFGIDALLALIVGLAQRYLEKHLHTNVEGPAQGTILEVSEDKGLGVTLNAIVYDGTLHVGDEIVIGTLGEPIRTKVRALFQPTTVGDIRDRKTRFASIQEAVAATGVKVSAPNLDGASAGMPFVAGGEEALAEIKKQVTDVSIETEQEGVVVKADNVGSLEAMITLLREKNMPIRTASIGLITKKDIVQAASHPPEYRVILAFNIKEEAGMREGVQVMAADVIYKLIDDYEVYKTALEKKEQEQQLGALPRPARIRLLEGCVFRSSGPLICGFEVLQGTLKPGARLVHEKDMSQQVGVIKEIQDKKVNLQEATTGMKVAVNIPGAVAERHVKEGDILWSVIDEEQFRELKKFAKKLGPQEVDTLKAYAEVMRKNNPLWGI